MATSLRLQFNYLFNPRMFVDYGPIKLGFSNDGDEQEVQYHANCLTWYENEMNALAGHISKGQNIVDVGANMGFMAVIFSQLAGPRGKVFCFEPSRITFAKLKRTVAINNLTNVEANNFGCGIAESLATLVKTSRSSGESQLAVGDSPIITNGAEEVRVVGLDEFLLPRAESVHFLKIDVEGHEPFVLKGARQILQKYRPTICIELGSQYRKSSEEAIQFLKANGYTFVVEPDLQAGSGTNFIAKPDARKSAGSIV
jgi:FkbM family methyltransferase